MTTFGGRWQRSSDAHRTWPDTGNGSGGIENNAQSGSNLGGTESVGQSRRLSHLGSARRPLRW